MVFAPLLKLPSSHGWPLSGPILLLAVVGPIDDLTGPWYRQSSPLEILADLVRRQLVTDHLKLRKEL